MLLCYDGSEPARQAIERAGRVLGGGDALMMTVWESVGSAILRHTPSGATELGREVKEISEDVVDELDSHAAKRAAETAREGTALAAAAEFEARPLAARTIARAAERATATVWRAVLAAADEADAELIVLGSRGRSGVTSMLLGSVAFGVVHNSTRPVLILPPPSWRGLRGRSGPDTWLRRPRAPATPLVARSRSGRPVRSGRSVVPCLQGRRRWTRGRR